MSIKSEIGLWVVGSRRVLKLGVPVEWVANSKTCAVNRGETRAKYPPRVRVHTLHESAHTFLLYTHIYVGGETQNYPIAGETQLANPGVCTPSPNRDTGIARFVSLVQCKFGAVLVIGLHT